MTFTLDEKKYLQVKVSVYIKTPVIIVTLAKQLVKGFALVLYAVSEYYNNSNKYCWV